MRNEKLFFNLNRKSFLKFHRKVHNIPKIELNIQQPIIEKLVENVVKKNIPEKSNRFKKYVTKTEIKSYEKYKNNLPLQKWGR